MERKEQREVFLIALAGLLCARLIGAFVIPVYDDAYITFRYADNLSRGIGFVYNEGENILGMTTPLYGLIASLIRVIGFGLPGSMIVFNILIDCILLYFLFTILGKRGYVTEFTIFAFLFSISPVITRVCVGAMEMNLFMLLSIAALYLYSIDKRRISIILGTIAYFIRPEGAILAALLVIYEFIKGSKKEALKMALLSVSILIIPLYILSRFYGNFIPQSLLAKTEGAHSSLYPVLKEFLFADPISAIALPFAVWGYIKHCRKDYFLGFIGFWSIVYLTLYLIARPNVWSWYPHTVRISVMLLASFQISHLLKMLARDKIRLNPKIASAAASVVIGFAWICLLLVLGVSSVTSNVYRPIEKWCSETDLRNKRFIASDIGAIGFYSRSYIFDTEGLVTPHARSIKQIDKMISEVRADYLLLIVTRDNLEMMRSEEFKDMFMPIKRFSRSGSQELQPSPDEYTNKWTQDYILYQRLVEQTHGFHSANKK